MAAEAADTVILIVSDVVTSALRYGGGTCPLALTAHPDSVEVAVHAPSPQAPRRRTPDLNGGTAIRLAHGQRPRPAPPRSPAGPTAARP
ncbi:hypothetical protein [Streptomyces chryseus]|uniref:hypothetical protein n=1 Tax=Streptomyces chryseus TaxID=68186 RepID=UPI00198DB879|nr:hypothetical protein GCM10010353_68570 [Streptomyces chryseus]